MNMSKLSKIVVTIVVVLLFLIIHTVIVGIRSDAGYKTPGFLDVIVFLAAVGALTAIWKKPKNKDGDDNSSVLQK